jgi:hypothetical protein
MPQATIKLQQAPAPASAQKISTPAPTVALKKGVVAKPAEAVASDDEEDQTASGEALPLPLLLASAALALIAFGIQLWAFIS